LNLGNPRLAPGTAGHETTEDFVTQELPIPTLGFEARRQLIDHLSCEGLMLANWINNVNSLRQEGGTVFLSQTEVHAHGRLVYANAAVLGPIQAFFGIGYVYYRQRETSHEDGNFIRLSSVGPEFGVRVSFWGNRSRDASASGMPGSSATSVDVLGEPVEQRQDRAGATLPSCAWIATALFGWWQGRTSRCAAR
jgi:hypothetical protein